MLANAKPEWRAVYYGVIGGYPHAIQTLEILVKGKCDAGLLLSCFHKVTPEQIPQ